MRSRPSSMHRALTWFVIVALALAGCASPPPRAQAPVAADDDYATITGVAIDGRAAAAPDAESARVRRGASYAPARVGFELQPGDVLETGARGELVVAYRNGSVLYMHHLSRGRVGSLLDVVGRVFVKVKGFFEVETTFVKAGARGTAFEVATTPDGNARVIVVDGAVDVASTRGLWQPVRLGAGSRGVAQQQHAPQPAAASKAELEAVEHWVDRLERLPTRADGGGSNRTRNTVVGAVAIAALLALLAGRGGRDGRDGAAGGRRDEPAGRTPEPTPPSPPPPPTLVAPTGLKPGSTTASRPEIVYGCRNLRLSWNAVTGARDYAYVIDQRGGRGWQGRSTTAATSDGASLAEGAYRWSVQARSGSTLGPSSTPVYFNCLPAGPVVR